YGFGGVLEHQHQVRGGDRVFDRAVLIAEELLDDRLAFTIELMRIEVGPLCESARGISHPLHHDSPRRGLFRKTSNARCAVSSSNPASTIVEGTTPLNAIR